jgi:hypothetical protein
MLKKQYDKPYECNHDSTIFFGKYKNQPHSVLIDDLKYCEWILSTEEGFAEPTKVYIKKYIIRP